MNPAKQTKKFTYKAWPSNALCGTEKQTEFMPNLTPTFPVYYVQGTVLTLLTFNYQATFIFQGQ